MHQHPRAPPVTASPASSPRTNPTRTNNPRDKEPGGSISGSDRGTPSEQGIGIGEGTDALLPGQESSGQAKDTVTKLSQVVQNYYTKAALIIIQSRVSLPPAYARGSDTKRVNKWFNVELDETDVLRDDVRTWKVYDVTDHQRPPPMIIEIFLDTEDLTNNQSLVVIDDHGKRWDVEEVLNAAADAGRGKRRITRPQVVLERWHIELGEPSKEISKDLAALLPRIYKNSIVLFRSLFTYAKLLPAWKFSKKLAKPRSSHSSLKLKYRITDGSQPGSLSSADTLNIPLFEGSGRVIEKFSFDSIESPAGSFSIKVSYRTSCDFRVDDSEALLSSHFMGMDDHYFEPSLGHEDQKTQHKADYFARGTEAGSLPPQRKALAGADEQGQAYGSLSTFHQAGRHAGASPLSALRAARELNTPSPANSSPQKPPANQRSAQGSRSSVRSIDVGTSAGRRASVSFVPFKAPSLSASPAQAESLLPSSPRGSLGRTSTLSALAEARNRAALGVQNKPPSRESPVFQDNTFVASVSTSPKPPPLSRYSSSFGHRRARLSAGGGSRTDDDNNSSGKTSITSSAAQPGSGIIAEGGGGSSGSLQTDDDNISDFLKMLDQKKELKSFQHANDSAAADASTRRTTAALSKFQRMRDSNAALSDSMSSSMLLHRSSSSSSRQLSAVPPMVSGTSMSISSSPGKPISPHTPHTPAIPSRLSANSIIEYPQRNRRDGRHRLSREEEDNAVHEDGVLWDAGTGAIDIPTSPRPFHPSYRRSSSVAQQPRTMPLDDDMGDIFPFGMRSASLGSDERPPLSLSALLGLQEGSDVAIPTMGVAIPTMGNHSPGGSPYRPAPQPDDGSTGGTTQQSSSPENREASSQQPRGVPYRPRLGRGGNGRGHTSPHCSLNTSLAGGDLRNSAGSGSSDQRGGRYSATRPTSAFEEEEPLLFAMSDFGANQQSRRSVDEARGGGESGPSARRGSRRGGSGGTWT